MLSFFVATMIGAGLGLERRLRDISPRVVGCMLAGAGGWLVAYDLGALAASRSSLFFALAAGAAAVALMAYISETTRAGGREKLLALAAAAGFGLMLGLGATKLVGLMGLIAIFGLAWRRLEQDAGAAGPSVRKPVVALAGRGPEESRHDDESRQQREDQRQGEELAHP